jgi:hypothetical protein
MFYRQDIILLLQEKIVELEKLIPEICPLEDTFTPDGSDCSTETVKKSLTDENCDNLAITEDSKDFSTPIRPNNDESFIISSSMRNTEAFLHFSPTDVYVFYQRNLQDWLI